MLNPVILALVRHVMTAAAGGLVVKGYIGADDVETVSGALAGLVGVGLSVWEKRKYSQQ